MTVVTKASPPDEASPVATSERLRDALASVSNHAVLRGPATGHIDVPELGRIAVRARTTGGSVDVDVTADRADTRAVLRGHVGGMTADLNQAAVPVSRVTVDRGTAAFGDSQGSSARDSGANRQDSSREHQTSVEQDDEPTPADTGTAKRVRIVL
jgi:flagellar hook-length control protein FliK